MNPVNGMKIEGREYDFPSSLVEARRKRWGLPDRARVGRVLEKRRFMASQEKGEGKEEEWGG